MHGPSGPAGPKKVYEPGFRGRRFLNWFPLGLMYAAYYMGRYNLTVANPFICSELGWTKAEFGVVISACLIVYGLSVLLNGPMADRIGGRKAILIGAVGAFAFNLVFGAGVFARFLSYFILVGMVQYYFQTFGALSVVKVNAAWFHISERGFFAGLFGAMIQFGRFLAVGLGGFIVAALPWQWVFWIPAMVLLANFVLSFILVRNTPEDLGYKRVDDKLAHEDDGAAKPTIGSLLRVLFSSPTLVVIAMSMMCTGVIRHSIEQWGPAYFKEVQGVAMDSFVYQFAFIGQIVSAILGAMVMGTVSDRFFQSRRGPVTAISYVAQAILLLIFGMAKPGPWGAAAILIVVYFFLNGCHGLLAGTASMDFGGRKAAASAAGMLDGAQYLAGSTVGVGMGALLDTYGWQIWSYAVIPLGLVAAVLMGTRWRTLPKKSGEREEKADADKWGIFFVGLFLFPLALLIWAFVPAQRKPTAKKMALSGMIIGLLLWAGGFAAYKTDLPSRLGMQRVQKKAATMAIETVDAALTAPLGKSFALAKGFAPDPLTEPGSVTGELAGPEVGRAFPKNKKATWERCKGYYTARPSYALELKERFEMLRVFVTSEKNTALIVRRPDGELYCVDDTGIAGWNPIIGRELLPGTYQIWVGSHEKGTPTRFTLSLTATAKTQVPRVGRWW